MYELLPELMLGTVKLSKYSMKMLDREIASKRKKRRKCGNRWNHYLKMDRARYRKRREKKIESVLEYKYTLKGRYVRMKADAKRRGAEWNLSPKDWATLWLKVREATGRTKPWTYSGYKFKRRDSKLPIQLGNLDIYADDALVAAA